MLLNLKELKEKYKLNINGVLHIGGHFGQEFSLYRELQINNIIFFEPVPQTFKKLFDNIGENAILFNIALGNIVGNIEMNIEENNDGQSSSILEPHLHLKQYPSIIFDKKITINIDKLDNYIKYKNDYNFINIDVQGYELEVFKGGSEFLNYIDYIITEVNNDDVYLNCAKVNELDEYLLKYNFERVETTWDGGTWGDALYIKTK